jgi:hypothetical protein
MINIGARVREMGLFANDERGLGRVKRIGDAPKRLSLRRTVYVVYEDGSDDYYTSDEIEEVTSDVPVPTTMSGDMYPQELVELVRRANAAVIRPLLSKRSGDGRANSIEDEATVNAFLYQFLPDGDALTAPPVVLKKNKKGAVRYWWDMRYDVNGIPMYPINTKVVDENAWNMGGLIPWFWASSDFSWSEIDALINKKNPVRRLNELLASARCPLRSGTDNGRDYFYIVYGKHNSVFTLLSLKTLGKIATNPANPFGQADLRHPPIRRAPYEAYAMMVKNRYVTVCKQYENLDMPGITSLYDNL